MGILAAAARTARWMMALAAGVVIGVPILIFQLLLATYRKGIRNYLLKGFPPRPLPARATHPAWGRHRTLDLETGVKMHVVEAGDPSKPLLLCLHGFPESWFVTAGATIARGPVDPSGGEITLWTAAFTADSTLQV
jgi:hypothetical protein